MEDYIIEYHEVTTENNQYPALTSSRKGIFLQTEYFAGNQIASDDNTGYNIVPYGYFTYRHMSDDEIFHFNINDIVENGIVSTLYPVFTTNDKLDSRYLQYQLNYGYEFARFAVLQKQGGSRTYMYLSKLKQLSLTMPKDIEEQKKISGFFMELDNLITLHQRMLQANDINKPCKNVNFTHYWEQRKLGSIVERITRKNQDLESDLPLTISAQYGLIDQNEFFDKRIASKDVSGYFLVKNGEFAYNKSTSSDAPWGAIKRLDRYDKGVLSTLYIVFRILDEGQTNSDYLVTYYDTDLWHKGIKAIAAEGARNHGLLNIAPADFFETTLSIPQDIEEQKLIGKYFKELNSLITLHQRQPTITAKI